MDNIDIPLFENEEKDVLQELMNISFGNAAADLAAIIDVFVVLNVPSVQILGIGDLPVYILDIIKPYANVKMVEQKFWGDFKGAGLLILPDHSTSDLAGIFEDNFEEVDNPKMAITLENDMLMEIGNMLIGACVGKVAELLGTVVTYSPPNVHSNSLTGTHNFELLFNSTQRAIILKTIFQFEEKNVSGLLLILTNEESLTWLKKALQDFMAQY